jgi:hypothetical protein
MKVRPKLESVAFGAELHPKIGGAFSVRTSSGEGSKPVNLDISVNAIAARSAISLRILKISPKVAANSGPSL